MKPETSLSRRVAKGGSWVFALRVLENGLKFIKLVIVARLLAPQDFGLFGIALLAMSALETFSQTGFQAALVQKKGDITPYLDNAWTVSIMRGLFLFCILFFGAPYIALFFNNPKAAPIIQVIGASLLVGGLTNSGIVYFQKELEFNKQFFYRLSTTIVDFAVVLIAGLILRNVWALVFGLLAGSLAGVIASYIIHPYRPRIRLDFTKARELFGFGRWVFGSAVLVFLVTQGDDAFVGKFLGATMLGFYQMAYRISNMPATEITHVISQVSFPAYAKIQAEKSRLKEAYLRILQITAFLSCLIAGLILVLAPDFTEIFLGQKWMFMVPAMQVLACAGLVRSIAATTGPLFYAVGMPRVDTRWQFIRLLVMAVLIYPCTAQGGIVGASIAVLVSIVASTVGFSYKAMAITGHRLMGFGKSVLPPLINGTIMVAAVFFLKHWIGIQGLLGFLALFTIGTTLYCVLAYLFNRRGTDDIRWLVKEGFNLATGR
jgi:lipopolysaccharide exporter